MQGQNQENISHGEMLGVKDFSLFYEIIMKMFL